MNATKIIDKYKLDQKSWTSKGAHAILHFFFVVSELSFKPLKDYYGECCKLVAFFIQNNYVKWYWNDEDMVRLRKSFLKKVHHNPKFLDQLLKEWHTNRTQATAMIDEGGPIN